MILLAVMAISPPQIIPGGGSSMNGNKLLAYCEHQMGSPEWTLCMGYIQGSTDQIKTMRRVFGDSPISCVPASVTIGQMMDVGVEYLRAHPETRHLDASSLMLDAATKAFPC